jgi:type VI secretion system secreted protein VgrG
MRMKKGLKIKSLIAVLAAFIMVSPANIQNLITAHAAETYGKAYTIGNILSDYQYFVQRDLTATTVGHCVGAVAIGGTLNSDNTVGSAQTTASYVKNLKKLSDFPQGQYINQTPYCKYKVDVLYYDSIDNSFPAHNMDWLLKKMTKNPNYIDFNSAFHDIKKESESLVKNSSASYICKDGVLTINLNSSTDNNISIPYSQLCAAHSIVIDGISCVQDFVNHRSVISVTDVGNHDCKLSCYGVSLNKGQLSQSLIGLSGGSNGGQINLDGMKLIWNFPDATGNVTAEGLAGHLVAPQANVILTGGNFEGGVIAGNVSKADAEGHYYPYNKPGFSPEKPTQAPVITSTPGCNNTTTVPQQMPASVTTNTTEPAIQPIYNTPSTNATVIADSSPTATTAPTTPPTATPTPIVVSDQGKVASHSKKEKAVCMEFDLNDKNPKVAGIEKTPAKAKKAGALLSTQKPMGSSSPKTGEHTPFLIFAAIALVSGIGIVLVIVKKKLNKKISKQV